MALSVLAYADPNATVIGLNDIPREDWPPVLWVHLWFQVMIAIGMLLAGLALWSAWCAWRRRIPDQRWFLRLLVLSMPLGFVAIEAGWMVTELGRQPWIIHGVMRTSEAVTPVTTVGWSLLAITLVYLALGAIVLLLVRRHVLETTAAPRQVLVLLLQILLAGAVVLLPSLVYLFSIFSPSRRAT